MNQNLGLEHPQVAGSLAQLGGNLLQQQKHVESEPLLRECLAIREKTQPDDWTTFNTKSSLGGSLLGQKKYADAEPLLIAGYEGMKAREDKIPPHGKVRLAEALQRLVDFYAATGQAEKADEWRAKIEADREPRTTASAPDAGANRAETPSGVTAPETTDIDAKPPAGSPDK